MASIYTEEEAGLRFGTEVTLIRQKLSINGAEIWLSITGDRTAPITLKFDRAGYNHYDDLDAYCFKLPNGEELWINFFQSSSVAERIKQLREIFVW